VKSTGFTPPPPVPPVPAGLEAIAQAALADYEKLARHRLEPGRP
jgi:hypothetical protein